MKISEELLKKYFNGDCSESEAAEILKWFSTDEGIEYLNKRMDEDFASIAKNPFRTLPGQASGIRSEKMWNYIKQNRSTPVTVRSYYSNRSGLFLKVAALVAILISASVIYLKFGGHGPANSVKMATYQAGPSQQKVLTLADGTKIRLNCNSRIQIPEKVSNGERKLILDGEAYFEVKHNPDRPLVISVGDALVRDIGTKFNVKEDTLDHVVQVAVTEGEVALRREQDSPEQATHLVKGQFAVLNMTSGAIQIDQKDIANYLSWVNGRIAFDATSLPEISEQLHRIFGVDCTIRDENLRELKLTANFESHSIRQVLNVISTSLDIHYKLEGNHAVWMNR